MTTPQSIKLFVGVETNLGDLESKINAWIRESGAEVVNIFGNIAPQTQTKEAFTGGPERRFAGSDIMLAVVYRDGKTK
jgi:hypothetical protein